MQLRFHSESSFLIRIQTVRYGTNGDSGCEIIVARSGAVGLPKTENVTIVHSGMVVWYLCWRDMFDLAEGQHYFQVMDMVRKLIDKQNILGVDWALR